MLGVIWVFRKLFGKGLFGVVSSTVLLVRGFIVIVWRRKEIDREKGAAGRG